MYCIIRTRNCPSYSTNEQTKLPTST